MKKQKGNIQREEHQIRSMVHQHVGELSNLIYNKLTECIKFSQNLSPNQFVRKWLMQHADHRTNHILAGGKDFESQSSMRIQNINLLLQTTNLLNNHQWNYKMTDKFVHKVMEKDHDLIQVLAQMKVILQGYFSMGDQSMVTKVISMEPLGPLQAYFWTQTEQGYSFFWEVGIDKIPRLGHMRRFEDNELIGYDYYHTITFFDFRYDAKIENTVSKIVKPYHKTVMSAQHRQEFQNIVTTQFNKSKHQLRKDKNQEYLFEVEINDLGNIHGELKYRLYQNDIIKWLRNHFPTQYLTKQEQSFYKFDPNTQRWVNKDFEIIQEAKIMREYQAKINKDLLKRYADFSSAAKLVELLQRIPNFKIKLTEQEQEVVGSEGNVMVIGRSGTGKTTCAILRLFAMETLFRLRLSLFKQKHENVLQNYKYNDQDVDDNVGLHCVFATASPVLTTEVKRYYIKLTEQIKMELEKKRQREREKRMKEQLEQKQQQLENQFNQSVVQVIEQNEKQAEEQYFAQQIGDIQLQQEQGAFKEELNEEEWDQEEEKLKKELDVFHSFQDMKDKDFPAFLTIKKLILLVDGSLHKPFFSRTGDNKIVGTDSHAQWSTENNGVIFINSYKKADDDIEYDEEEENIFEDEINVDELDEQQLEQEYQRQMYLMNKPAMKAKIDNSQQKISQEVDYEFFVNRFWYSKFNKYQHVNGLNPSFVWTQIYSHIKGSAQCHTYPGHYMPKRVYLRSVRNEQLFDDIFECYILYERWKIQQGYYDFMDVVNHILVQLMYGRSNIIPIHYLMIDEVQDLPHAVLVLLCKITEQGLFFSGDTAQNIAKGVGFRFQDLKSLFANRDYYENFNKNDLKIHQLTINFRSHNNILQLANSLVTLLEIFFPKTIDKLQKERSDIGGPKPILVNGSDEALFYLLSGEGNNQQVGSRLPIEFGCNQVVIVKDQGSKSKIPTILQHALVLTIYEAKGLEFDDVILYNFFQDNYIGDQQWKLIQQQCNVLEVEVDKKEYLDSITKHNHETEVTEFQCEQQENNEKVKIKRVMSTIKYYDEQTYYYSQLCNEIKQLYVAVTRPRQRLIIYDENPLTRVVIENLWKSLDLVDYFDDTQMENKNVEKIAKKTSPAEWKKQGIKMFRNKFYEQAEKCFSQAQDEQLLMKARAYRLASEGNQLIQKQTQLQTSDLKKKEKNAKIKQIKIELLDKFTEAANLFLKIQNPKQAAQCYYSGEQYEEALQIYLEQNMYCEAGEAAYKCQKYQEAAQYFIKGEDIIRTVDSFEKGENYEGIFKSLIQLKDKIPVETRSAFLRKYLPIVLNKMSSQIGQLEQIDQEKDKNKKEQINQQIVEEESSDDDDEDEDDQEIKQEPNKQTNEKQRNEEQQIIQQVTQQVKEEEKPDIIELSSVMLQSLPDQSQQPSLIKQVSLDNNSEGSQSFTVQQSESFQVENSKQENSKIVSQNESESFQVENSQVAEQTFEHLSHYDPEDQWLQNDNKSIIESIASKKSAESDFSAFSYAYIINNPNVQFVRTKGDISIHDSIMQQIIKYISMFSEEFKYELLNQRSKSAQLSNKPIDQNEFDYMVDFILDLDLVDISFIYLVLDILEQFKNYKLCIFVCNRYKLADQLGRYLVSIASTYSPLAIQSASLNVTYLTNGQQRQAQVDKGLVAAFAVHNVFENINWEFIKLKLGEEELTPTNSLGLQCFQQLIMLGYWKKTVYQMDVPNSLSVCQLFMDYKNWRFIYYTHLSHLVMKKMMQNESDPEVFQIYSTQSMLISKKLDVCFHSSTRAVDQLIFNYPKDQSELDFALITIEQYYSELITQLVLNNKIPFSVFFRNNTSDPKQLRSDLPAKQNLPKLYSISEEIINCIINGTQIQGEILNQLCDTILQYDNNKDDLAVYQSVFLLIFLCQVTVHGSNLLKSYIVDLETHVYCKLTSTLKYILTVLNTHQDRLQSLRKIITRCILFIFKVRQPTASELLKPFINSVIIHRSSIIISGLVEKRHNLQLKGQNIVLDDYYFADIDFEFITAPRSQVMYLITQKLQKEIESFVHHRFSFFAIYKFDDIEPNQFEEYVENVAIFLASKFKQIEIQQNIQSNTGALTVDDWVRREQQLNKQKQIESFNLKHGFQGEEQEEEYNFTLLLKHRQGNLFSKSKYFLNYMLQNVQLQAQSIESKNYCNRLAIRKLYKSQNAPDADIQHCLIIKSLTLFNYSCCNHYSYQYLNNKIEEGFQRKYEPYLQYLEYLICKKANVIQDATDCYLQYYEAKQQIIPPDEQLFNLTSLVLNNIVGIMMNNKQQVELRIPFCYLIYFDKIQPSNDEKYTIETNIHPVLSQDNLNELIDLLIQIYQEHSQIFNQQILFLIYVLAVNLDQIQPKLLNSLKTFLTEITDPQDKQMLEEIFKALKSFTKPQQIQERLELLTINSSALKLGFAIDTKLYQLTIKNKLNSQNIDAAYQQCLDDWANLQMKSENLEKNTKKIISTYREYKKTVVFQQPNKFSFGEYSLPRKFKTSKYQNIIHEFIRTRKLLTSTFYSMLLTNAIDFHFISQQMNQLTIKENQFNLLWKQFRGRKITIQEFEQNYEQQKKDVEQFIDILIKWQKNNVTFEQNANKLLERNRKLLALKWMTNRAGMTLQKIQKRKKGLKRQELLDRKKILSKL